MPMVTVQVTREGTKPGVDHVTAEEKAAIYKGISQVLFDVLGKPPEWTWVVFEEVEMENWGWGGMPVADYRKQLAGKELRSTGNQGMAGARRRPFCRSVPHCPSSSRGLVTPHDRPIRRGPGSSPLPRAAGFGQWRLCRGASCRVGRRAGRSRPAGADPARSAAAPPPRRCRSDAVRHDHKLCPWRGRSTRRSTSTARSADARTSWRRRQ